MPTIVDYAGEHVDVQPDVWTHGGASTHLPQLDRVILDLIDSLGYSPAEVSCILRLPLSRVAGTYWRSRWSAHRLANRVASVLRDGNEFDPRHAIVFELSAVCGYTFVEIGECLGYDRGHACRIASETAEKLRALLPLGEGGRRPDEGAGRSNSAPNQSQPAARFPHPDPLPGGEGEGVRLITALPAGDEVQTARDCRLHYAKNESLTPLERLMLWREMLDEGDFASRRELAAAMGLSYSSVKNWLSLLSLPAEWLQRVTHGELPLCFLRPLRVFKDRPDILDALAERLKTFDRRPSYLEWCRIVAEVARRAGDVSPLMGGTAGNVIEDVEGSTQRIRGLTPPARRMSPRRAA